MRAPIITFMAVAVVAVSAVEPPELAARLADTDSTKRAAAALDIETRAHLNQFIERFEYVTGQHEGLEKRQFEVCPFNECVDRCNFAPPFCFSDFCDWNTLGCIAGCCVACGC